MKEHQLLKFVEVRFLSMYAVVERILEQYDVINHMYTDEIPKKHPTVRNQPRVIRISEMLKNKMTLPSLHFISFALQVFKKYELLFQRNEPTVHLLYDKQVDILRDTLLCFCKLETVEKIKSGADLIKYKCRNEENVLALKDISIGIRAKTYVNKFDDRDRMVFLKGVKLFYQVVCDNLMKNMSLSSRFLANMRFLKPTWRTMSAERSVSRCATSLPPITNMTDKQVDSLSLEWRNLVLENIPEEWYCNVNIPN